MCARPMDRIKNRLWCLSRDIALALIAALWPGEDFASVEAKLEKAPPAQQVLIVAAVLCALFLCSLLAAQFGFIGILLFWLLIIWLIR